LFSVFKRYAPTLALIVLLAFLLPAGWLAIPAIILLIQVVTDRPGRLLRAVTGRSALRD
jgi:hypothetical protein